jgi:hypothetical protein
LVRARGGRRGARGEGVYWSTIMKYTIYNYLNCMYLYF